jgi:AcrR family transcriptional regulator
MARAAAITRQEQKEMTRIGLIETATRLFAKNGIANTATADVAKAQKVSHGTVFVHFPKREDLVLAVIDEFGSKLSQEFGNGLNEKEGDLESLLAFHLQVLAEYEDFYHRLISEMSQFPPKVKSMVFMLNAAVSWRLYESAKPLMEKRELKALTRAQLFNTWIALVQYHVLNRDLLTDNLPILKTKKRDLIDQFLHLITQKGERK